MKDNSVLLSHIFDLKEKAASQSIVVNTNFLSVDEISELIKNNRTDCEYTDTFFFGGYPEAERKVAVFIPRFYGVTADELGTFLNENDLNPVSILRITKDKFSLLSHRDYLGAVMGLGIKREMIGDITVNTDGCIMLCLKSISKYILENLKQAGRGQLTVEECTYENISFSEDNTETVFLSVASLRLDCVIAATFRLSRSAAVQAINQGLVYINSEQTFKIDRTVDIGDKVVLRGKGKAVLEEVTGTSKKGRIHINVKRYL